MDGSSSGTDRTRLVRIDLTTGEETEFDCHPELELDPRAVVSPIMPPPLMQDRRAGELLGVRYLGARQVIHALDPHFAGVLAELEKLSDGDIGRLASDDGGQRWVVGFNHDRDPGATYLYDHSTGASRLLFRPRPHLANNWHAYVGDPVDPDQLADMMARSPINRVNAIRTPLLVIHGANDVRVVRAESDNLVNALRARGVEVEYLIQTDEGHGAVNSENVIEMWHAISRFRARHLAGRA